MKFKNYSISLIAAGALITSAFMFNKEKNTSVYQPKKSIAFEKAIGSYNYGNEYAKLLKGDKDGNINFKDVLRARKEVELAASGKADPIGLIWTNKGPTNVGGRTRAVLVDKDNSNYILAGGVGGGVYVSFDGAQTWQSRIGGTNHLISAVAQTANGQIFIGTGPGHDGVSAGRNNASDNSTGDGLYRINDFIAEYEHLVVADGSLGWDNINQIVAHPTDADKIFIATGGGLQVSENASSSSPTFAPANGVPPSVILEDVDISSDGNIIIATTASRVYVSRDGGNSFTLNLDISAGRIECAMAPSDPNTAYLSIVNANDGGCLQSILQTSDAGVTWDTIASGGGTFDPFANPGVNCQGGYDNAIAVFPDDPGRVLVGGVQLWEGRQQPNSDPPLFGWTQVAVTGGSPQTSIGVYVHADKHRILIPDPNTVYVGSDGGIGKSTDGGNIWTQNNKGYNVTQFYSLALAPQVLGGNELVMGGTQDNGTLLVGLQGRFGNFVVNDPTEGTQVQGGDGFDCAISALQSATFTTSQNGSMRRFDAVTSQSSEIWDNELNAVCGNGTDCGPFFTTLHHWETPKAEVTLDSVYYTNRSDSTIPAGREVIYVGTVAFPQSTTLNASLDAGDSVLVPDQVQSKLMFANPIGSTIYLTRDAIDLSTTNLEWSRIAGPESYPSPFNGTVFSKEFTPDGNHLFVGTTGGALFRISNLSYAIDSLTSDVRSNACVLTCTELANFGTLVSDIAIDENNPENIIVTVAGYRNTAAVQRSTNAVSAIDPATAAFRNIQGDLPTMPVFSALISIDDNNTVVIGTEFGVWATANAFATNPASVEWAEENIGMPRIPTYRVRQQTNPFVWNQTTLSLEDAANYKTIYVATHGGGFFKTEKLVGIKDIKGGDKEAFKTNLKLYPNPARENTTLEFELNKKTPVNVSIFSIKGQLINKISLGNLTEGKQQIKLETTSLPQGTYFVRLEAGELTDVIKLVKAN